MNADQLRRFGIYRTLANVLARAPQPGAPVTLPAASATLQTIIERIDLLAQQQAQRTEGDTALRDGAFAAMAETTFDVTGLASAFAHAHRLTELFHNLNITPRAFNRTRLMLRPNSAQHLHDVVHAEMPRLAACGITAEVLADWQAKIDAATTLLMQPLAVAQAKRSATAQLAKEFREADALLTHQIDRLVSPLRKTHPEFYAEYDAARRANRRSHRRRSSREPTATGA
jgi:hypothetical protein